MKILNSALKLGLCAVLALGFVSQLQAATSKADGKWSWTMPARNGGQERTLTLTLKTEGEKLTGKLSSPGRQGNMMETEITEGKIKGDEVSFTVVREFNGNKMTSKYNGKVTADSIKGKVETDRQGQAQTRDWEAKRVKEEKK